MSKQSLNLAWGASLLVLLAVPGAAAAQPHASPPLASVREIPTPRPTQRADVEAIVVKSWFLDSEELIWNELNEQWPAFGEISIFIDTLSLGDSDSFAYEDLVQSGADVVILSDPAGGLQQYLEEEVDALGRYAADGHNVLGTYLLLQHGDTDNRALAPLFGLREDLDYDDDRGISNLFNRLVEDDPLFVRIPPSWRSNGYPYTQTPQEDLQWSPDDLAGAVAVAESDELKAMISVFDARAYTSIYISNMPEYRGQDLDKQLLYNAITYPRDCELDLVLQDAEVRPGDVLRWAVRLHHLRRETVTAAFRTWIEGPGERRYELPRSPAMTIEYLDEIRRRDGFLIPVSWPSGAYTLVVEIGAMRRGVLRRELPFAVVE